MNAFSTGILKSARTFLLLAVLALILSGCGGGGGSGSNDVDSQADSSDWDAMVWDQGDWG